MRLFFLSFFVFQLVLSWPAFGGFCDDIFSIYPLEIGDRFYEVQVLSRTNAEHLFERENRQFQEAGTNALVPIELVINLARFPLGHTNLRVGNALYEFGEKGWGVHPGEARSARAFLFNNPFFRRQVKQYGPAVRPYSMGIRFFIEKSKVLKFVDFVNSPEARAEKFRLTTKNCNSCMIEHLNQAGFDLLEELRIPKVLYRRLTIMTFRELLQNSPHTRGAEVHLYPVVSLAEFTNMDHGFPIQFRDDYTIFDEVNRIAKIWNPFKPLWAKMRGRQ